MISLPGKKLGLLLSGSPHEPGFDHGLRTAAAALRSGLTVYLYCIDQAVAGVEEPALQQLRHDGLILYGCAYSAQKYGIPINDAATFAGLGVLSDLISATDRFLSFC